MMKRVSVLAQYPVFNANSWNELATVGAVPLRIETIEFADPSNFHYAINRLELEQIAIGAITSSGHRVSIEDPTGITLLLSLEGRLTVESGGGRQTVDSDDAVIVLPGRRSTTAEPGAVAGLLRIPAQLVGQPSGSQSRPPVALEPHASLRNLSLTLLHELTVRPEPPPARTSALWEALVLDAVSTALQSNDEWPNAASVRQVRSAESYILANLSKPLTMQHVADHVGVSVRALQLAFRRHHDCS